MTSTVRQRVALVTGAARGNGLAIAHALARMGCAVHLADIAANVPAVPYALSSPAQLEEAVQSLRREYPDAFGVHCDVRDPAQVDQAVAGIEARHGGVDILVNNAGVLVLRPLHEVADAEWDVQMDTIARGAFNCCRRVLPGMNARRWGRIVNVASVAGHRGLGTGAVYTAAKHALIGLTRALALEVARQNITVNAVCPGTVDTDLVRSAGPAAGVTAGEAARYFSSRHLTGRPLLPGDVAEAVAWLASDAAARVNGTSLFVDDGWHVT